MEVGFWMHSLHPVQQLRMRNVNSAKLHKHLRAPCFRFYFESHCRTKQQRGWFWEHPFPRIREAPDHKV